MPVVVKNKISRNAGHHYGQVRIQRVEGITADSTVWTADTLCVTTDGHIVCIPANVVEPVGDRSPTADITLYTADATWPTADGGIIAGATDSIDAVAIAGGAVIDADVVEAADASDTADAISSVSADAVEPATALDVADAVTDVAADTIEAATAIDVLDAAVGALVLFGTVDEAAGATDALDASVDAVAGGIVGGGRYYPQPQPAPVVGHGYGVLPRLWGEGHGVVGAVAKGAAQLLVHATAVGACGQAGNATVVLKGLVVTGKGAIGARGSGEGMIVKFSGSATGQHDDDEAAVIAILLAA